MLKFSRKKFINFFLLGIDADPDWYPMPWMPIPIRQNVADPTLSGSGSTTTLAEPLPLKL
jgi:hypothetical protein